VASAEAARLTVIAKAEGGLGGCREVLGVGCLWPLVVPPDENGSGPVADRVRRKCEDEGVDLALAISAYDRSVYAAGPNRLAVFADHSALICIVDSTDPTQWKAAALDEFGRDPNDHAWVDDGVPCTAGDEAWEAFCYLAGEVDPW
jgi:hypothetical protein